MGVELKGEGAELVAVETGVAAVAVALNLL